MLQRRVILLDPAGGLAQEMAQTMRSKDVLIAIAFRHYAKEVVAIADLAQENATPLVAITDSALSPLAQHARVLFTVPEDEYSFSRSLAAPMCLAQSLATVTAAVLQPGSGGALRIPSVTEIAQTKARGCRACPKAGGGDGNRTCVPNNDAIEVSFQNHAEPGGPAMPTIRLTMAQALVRYLCNQFTIIDGKKEPLFAGLFGIFGHGNVTCLSEALEAVQDQLPTWRGQNEQSMALAAIGYAKAMRRRQIMVALSSIGPGALNMVTAAGCAHANRLPVLFLAGDIFANRRPDPVLQQVEHFGNPTVSVNDAFKAVSRYWDRITHPEQIISSLPQALATMLDPGDCGPAFIGLCQDTQELAFDYPEAFFAPTIHSIPRPRPDKDRVAKAIELLKGAKRPLIISGGGVRYSGAEKEVADFALKHGIPMAETIAGKGAVTHDHPAHIGPIGVVGSSSANALAGEADVILAIGTRLQDFTTGSWTVFAHDAQFISVNAARYDATKHRAWPSSATRSRR